LEPTVLLSLALKMESILHPLTTLFVDRTPPGLFLVLTPLDLLGTHLVPIHLTLAIIATVIFQKEIVPVFAGDLLKRTLMADVVPQETWIAKAIAMDQLLLILMEFAVQPLCSLVFLPTALLFLVTVMEEPRWTSLLLLFVVSRHFLIVQEFAKEITFLMEQEPVVPHHKSIVDFAMDSAVRMANAFTYFLPYYI